MYVEQILKIYFSTQACPAGACTTPVPPCNNKSRHYQYCTARFALLTMDRAVTDTYTNKCGVRAEMYVLCDTTYNPYGTVYIHNSQMMAKYVGDGDANMYGRGIISISLEVSWRAAIQCCWARDELTASVRLTSTTYCQHVHITIAATAHVRIHWYMMS